MKIFVLEDNPERMAQFSAMWIKEELVITNNVAQARKILENEKFSYVFLDHDLGGEVYVSAMDKNSGSYLCKHMHETKNVDTPIIVHSWNDVGAKQMIDYLMDSNHRGAVEEMMFLSEKFNVKVDEILSESMDKKRKENPPPNIGIPSAFEAAMKKIEKDEDESV